MRHGVFAAILAVTFGLHPTPSGAADAALPKNSSQPTVAPASGASACVPTTLTMPTSLALKLEGLPQPATGPGWFGSVVLAALLTGIATLIGTVLNADKRDALERQLQRERLTHAGELKDLEIAHEAAMQKAESDAKLDLANQEREFQAAMKSRELDEDRVSRHDSLGREDQRIGLERLRLQKTTDASAIEIEVSAIKLAREHGFQFANLMHTYFDRLTSSDPIHRELALLAMGEVVDTDELTEFLASKFDAATESVPTALEGGIDGAVENKSIGSPSEERPDSSSSG